MIAFLAQSSSEPAGGGAAALLVPILLMGGLFYFMLIRPQQRRARQQRQLTQDLNIGDEVLTVGGIYGVIRDVDEDSITVEISPGNSVRMVKQAVARKMTEEDEGDYEEPEGEPGTSS